MISHQLSNYGFWVIIHMMNIFLPHRNPIYIPNMFFTFPCFFGNLTRGPQPRFNFGYYDLVSYPSQSNIAMENDETMTYSVPEDKFLSRPFSRANLEITRGHSSNQVNKE